MSEKKFKVHWGLSVKIITFTVLILLIAVVCDMINDLSRDYSRGAIITIFIILCCVIGCSLEIPRLITINENEVVLHKLIGKLVIDINSITYIAPYKPDKSEIRLFGIGGIGGFTGIFMNAGIGKYRAYIGDLSQAFLIITEQGKKYVLSCENKNLAISTIKSLMQI